MPRRRTAMRRAVAWLVLGAALLLPARPVFAALSDSAVCEAAAEDAEHGFGLPPGLLRAIGLVESGRWQAGLGRQAPWPYAIDAGGYSLFMESLPDAVAKVAALRRDGLQSIDVGCFQINLLFHPSAFATIEDAFDPAANAAYAARFLLALYARSGSWEAAVAQYHSAVPAIGFPYRAKVYAAWQGGAVALAGWRAASPGLVQLIAAGPLAGAALRATIRVYVPSGPAAMPPPGLRPSLGSNLIPRIIKRGLPVVFTP